MKYNDPIENNENEAHNIILKKIVPGSIVLEFGAANGRMTTILKNVLNCKVYIVEIEEADFEEAMQYAEDGICDDIEMLSWKKWGNVKFDYIIFADVLEHLENPSFVLNETYDLLKDDGSILVSVPNVAHNDIWAKLYLNHFDYTNIGILDNTHLHFYAEESLVGFEKDSKYKLINLDYKTIPTLTTEQFLDRREDIPMEIMQLLYTRKNGEVYQFIMELKKKEFYENTPLSKPDDIYPNKNARIYFERGNGFSQEDGCDINVICDEKDECTIDAFITVPEDVVRIRIDPIEGVPCLLKYIDVEGCQIVGDRNDIITDQGVILYTSDPKILCDVKMQHIRIKLIYLYGYKKISDVLYAWEKRLEQHNLLESMMGEFKQTLSEIMIGVEHRCDDVAMSIRCIQEESEKHNLHVSTLIEEKSTLIEEKNTLIKEKSTLIEEKSALLEKVASLEMKISEMTEINIVLEQKIKELSDVYEKIIASKWWKIANIFRRK